MKNHLSFFLFAACVAMLAACVKEEPLNQECDILSAWVEGDSYAAYFYQPSLMRVDNLPSDENHIVFYVLSDVSLPTDIPVYFTLTEGATISPNNGSAQDFTAGPVQYVVTSEDDAYCRQYTVEFRPVDMSHRTFSFEHVDSSTSGSACYHLFYELDLNGSRNYLWASGNPGVALLHSGWTPDQFPTRSVTDGYIGRGVCLTTQDVGPMGQMMHKPIAAGNLFMGRFDIGQVLSNSLRSTVFGTPVNQEPVKVTGYYKYHPGEVFTDIDMNPVEGREDEASIYAVFFRNENAAGESVFLYGDDVNSSPYIVKKARVASLPATDEWTPFEMTFDDGIVDAVTLANYGYSMTVVFSSSRDGDLFEGAVGSTLFIDEVKVEYATPAKKR